MTEDEIQIDLGTCCACGGVDQVRNIIMLPFRAPWPGYGWGCVVCGLPAEGAVAVVCDGCLSEQRKPQFVCDGPPTAKGREPTSALVEPFDHDESKHTELEPPGVPDVTFGVCEKCGCTDKAACRHDDGTSCYWVTATLCSACVEAELIDAVEGFNPLQEDNRDEDDAIGE